MYEEIIDAEISRWEKLIPKDPYARAAVTELKFWRDREFTLKNMKLKYDQYKSSLTYREENIKDPVLKHCTRQRKKVRRRALREIGELIRQRQLTEK